MPANPTRIPVSAIVVVVALAAAATLGVAGSAAALPSPATLVVGSAAGEYATIGAAIAAASAGDTIQVTAGTYTENLDVTIPLTLLGAGTSSTELIGTLTLDAPTDVSGLTLLGQATVPSSGGPDPIWMNPGAAGSNIHGDVIGNGNDAVYASGITGTSADPTLIEHNTINEFHGPQGNGVWIWQSSFFDVDDNTITDGTPIDDNSAGVNLGCGASDVNIDGNTFSDLDNAVVDIADDQCGASTDITIENNSVTDTDSSSLYFGGNNITNVTIAGNTIKTVGGTGGGIVISGYDGWLADPSVPIEGFTVSSNLVSGAPNGLYIGEDAQLGGDSAVTSTHNTYCSAGLAIDNETIHNAVTGGFTVASVDDDFCGTPVTPGVVVTVTPPASGGGTPGSGGSTGHGATSGSGTDATTPATAVDPAGALAVTGGSGTSSSAGSQSSPSTSTPTKTVKTAVQTSSSAFPIWLIAILALLVLLVLFFLVFVVARRRGDA